MADSEVMRITPPSRRARRAWAGVAGLALLVAACATGASPERPVVVGAGSTREQSVLAALTVAALERAEFDVELREDLGATVDLRREAIQGDIDLFWDYTGAAWVLGLHQESPPADPTESYRRVRRADQDRDLEWLGPTEANATLSLFVARERLPDDPDAATLSWLSSILSSGEATLCADPDFVRRAGGLDALAEAYAINQDELQVKHRTEEEAIRAVAAGECVAGLATATSGTARNAGLVPVTDDLVVFPAFVVAPVAREEVVDELPMLEEALAPIIELLDTERLASLNASAEAGTDPQQLAEELLADMVGEEPGEE